MSLLRVPFGLAGAGIGMGIVGEAISSTGLTEAGGTAVGFVKPAVSIAAGGLVVRMLKDIKHKKL